MTHWKVPDAGKDWRQQEKRFSEDEMAGWQCNALKMMQWTWTWADWEMVRNRESWSAAVHRISKNQTWLSNWTKQHSINYNIDAVFTADLQNLFILHNWFRAVRVTWFLWCFHNVYSATSLILFIFNTGGRGKETWPAKPLPCIRKVKAFPEASPQFCFYSVSVVKIDLSVISSSNGDSEAGKEAVIWEWAVS